MVLCLLFFQKGAPTIFHLSELLFFPPTMLDCFHKKKKKERDRVRERGKGRERETNRKNEKKNSGSTDRRILYYIFLPNSDLCFPSPALTKGS